MHRDRIVSDSLSVLPDGSLRVAGAALLTDVVRNADVIQRFPLLASACEQSCTAERTVRQDTQGIRHNAFVVHVRRRGEVSRATSARLASHG